MFGGVFGGFHQFAEAAEGGCTLGGLAQAVEVGDVRGDIGAGEEGDDGEDAQAACAGQGVQVEVAVGEVEREQRRVVVVQTGERVLGLCAGGLGGGAFIGEHGWAPFCGPSVVEGAGAYHAGRRLQGGWARIITKCRTKCVDSMQISEKSQFSTSDFWFGGGAARRIASIAPHSA